MRWALAFWLVLFLAGPGVCGFWKGLRDAASSVATNSTSEDGFSGSELEEGLKEALIVGAKRAVAQVSREGGFLNNPKIRIPLPSHLERVASVLKRVGYAKEVEAFEVSMNRAAERAASKALPIFLKAVKEMTFEDARRIYTGGDHAATDYFRKKTWDELYGEFRPIVKESMDKVEVTRRYRELFSSPYARGAASYAGVKSLEDYVTKKALDGLFTVLALEEERIRKDPAARSTELLRKLFR